MPRSQVLVAGVILGALLAACQPVVDYPPDKAAAYAQEVDAIVENSLVGLSSNDVAAHTKDFDQDMKDAVDSVSFPSVYQEIIGPLGKYHSRALVGVQEQGSNVIVKYTTVFDNDPNVTLRVVFDKGDPQHHITGMWFDSELLKGN